MPLPWNPVPAVVNHHSYQPLTLAFPLPPPPSHQPQNQPLPSAYLPTNTPTPQPHHPLHIKSISTSSQPLTSTNSPQSPSPSIPPPHHQNPPLSSSFHRRLAPHSHPLSSNHIPHPPKPSPSSSYTPTKSPQPSHETSLYYNLAPKGRFTATL